MIGSDILTQTLFNNILAVIGALTGIIGLIISLTLLSKEKLKLTIIHPTNEPYSAYAGFNGVEIGKDNYGEPISFYTPYVFFIYLQISNSSKLSTTILDMSLKIHGCDESILNKRTSDNYSITATYSSDEHDNIFVNSCYGLSDITKPPISIDSYSAIEGYFFFRDLKLDKRKSYNATLKVKTTQGIEKIKIVIKPKFPELLSKNRVGG